VLEPSGDQSYPGDLADMPGALFSEFEGTVKRAASGTTRSRLELAVIGAALLTVPVTFLQLSGHSAPWLTVADWAIWFVFVADYAHAVSAAPDRRTAACRHWISAVVVVLSFPILPHVLAFTRLTRLSRLVRLARLVRLIVATSRGLQGVRVVFARRGLLYVTIVTGVLSVAGGGLLSLIEPEMVEGSFLGGIWWAIISVITVGYDEAPATIAGRVVAVLLMLSGIGLASTLAAATAAYFVGQEEQAELRDIEARLARIEAMLQEATRHRQEDT
jgi:voltage-gated potassium channel